MMCARFTKSASHSCRQMRRGHFAYYAPRQPLAPNTHHLIGELAQASTVTANAVGELFISKFDPKTLKLTEYPTKEFKSGAHFRRQALVCTRLAEDCGISASVIHAGVG